ncbi:MAG TPA: hypothetical protein VF021_03815 [Longimicrobiales bacterium]
MALPGLAAGQDPLGWNSPRALDLISRARVRRELPRGDSTLQNYKAKANGFVYFYLDRREDAERTLVKVDQVALDLFWKRPNLTKQHIVGLRDVSRLPNRMYYHLDHLTVVQNGLGDVIKIGDGDEVRDVPHPAAPGADSIYDYRLADSVTLQLGGGQPEVRVYEINVRPRRTNRSALIGSLFVDRASADIVRMTFTFTPVSYVDRRLDYINISLDNGLFGGRYWLPNEQSVEIRRQIPELDFAAGAVIKGRLRVTGYEFNAAIPDTVFNGRPVTAAPEVQRKNFPFPDDIYAGVAEEGLAPPPQMAELRAQAAELVRERRLSGLPPWRLYIPNASSVLRHDSLEGWYGGLGVAYVPTPTFRMDWTGGYAFGAARPEATVALHYRPRKTEWTVRGYFNEPRDIGPIVGMPGVLNTFASAFGDRDYTDRYFTRGVAADVSAGARLWQRHATMSFERHRSGPDATIDDVQDGDAVQVAAGISRLLPEQGLSAWGVGADLAFVHFRPALSTAGTQNFPRFLGTAQLRANSESKRSSLLARLDVGATLEPAGHDAPRQFRFLSGGRETLPGYRYRQFDANAFGLARVEASRSVWDPWVRGRVLASAAMLHQPLDAGVPSGSTWQTPASAGVGFGLLWDVIRVDVVKGAHWQTLVSVRRDFWDML